VSKVRIPFKRIFSRLFLQFATAYVAFISAMLLRSVNLLPAAHVLYDISFLFILHEYITNSHNDQLPVGQIA